MNNKAILSAQEIDKRLQGLRHWSVKAGKLAAEFSFDSFADAFSFMTRVSFAIEAKNHHPEWFNVYNKLKVEFVTHDAGGITDKDFEMAGIFSSLYQTFRGAV